MAVIPFVLVCLLPALIMAKVKIKQVLLQTLYISLFPQPQYASSGIPANVLEGLPSQTFYQPEKSPNIPILPGERSELKHLFAKLVCDMIMLFWL